MSRVAARLWPVSVLLLGALAVTWPLWVHPGWCSDDGPFHLFRAVALGWLVEHGHLFPRWSPHMAWGYGFPFFNFYAPLTSYAVVALNALTANYTEATRWAFGLAVWLAGVSAYALARQWWGRAASLVAGLMYLSAPYLAYDVMFRGNLAETAAFIWPPLVALGLHHLAHSATGRARVGWGAVTALAYAALVLTHNVTALLVSPWLAGWAVWLTVPGRRWPGLLGAAGALTLGLALTAYFWFPAFSERALIHAERLLEPPVFTWYTNFITPAELLAPPWVDDSALINPAPPRALGLLPAMLAGLGAVIAWRLAPAERGRVAFGAVSVTAYAALTLEVTAPVWRAVPLLELAQFPWRLLAPASLALAWLMGAGAHALNHRWPRWSAALAPLITVMALGAGLAWWSPRPCPAFPAPTLGDMLAYERGSGTFGTTAKGEYQPRTSQGWPAATDLAEAIEQGLEPPRLHATADWHSHRADPLNAHYTLTATAPLTVTYRQFFYPGWQVTLDGQPVTVYPSMPEGLIEFAVPPGVHDLRITFGWTPPRQIASLVSALAWGVALVGLMWGGRGLKVLSAEPADAPPARWGWVMALALLALARPALIEPGFTPLRAANALAPTQPVNWRFEGGMAVFGLEPLPATLAADQPGAVTLWVRRWQASLTRYWPVFRLVDAHGVDWLDADRIPPRQHREPPHTPFWPEGGYAHWVRTIAPRPGTPPGVYTLTLEIFDLDNRRVMSALDEADNAAAPQVTLGAVTVTRPAQSPALAPETPATADFGPARLLGFHLPHRTARVGDRLPVWLYWEAGPPAGDPLTVQLAWVDTAGKVQATQPIPPVPGWPTTAWQTGDRWLGAHTALVPADLPGGVYALQVRAATEPVRAATEPVRAATEPVTLGTVTVTAPARQFTVPPMAMPVQADFAGVGRLLGYTLTQTGTQAALMLVWQASATPAQALNVFVHYGDEGRVLAQTNAPPAGGARPTTGWLAGEVIVDIHTLTLPAEPGQWYVGLFDPLTGARVTTPASPDGRVRLP